MASGNAKDLSTADSLVRDGRIKYMLDGILGSAASGKFELLALRRVAEVVFGLRRSSHERADGDFMVDHLARHNNGEFGTPKETKALIYSETIEVDNSRQNAIDWRLVVDEGCEAGLACLVGLDSVSRHDVLESAHIFVEDCFSFC